MRTATQTAPTFSPLQPNAREARAANIAARKPFLTLVNDMEIRFGLCGDFFKATECERCGVMRGSAPWGEGIDDNTEMCRSCEQAFIDECEAGDPEGAIVIATKSAVRRSPLTGKPYPRCVCGRIVYADGKCYRCFHGAGRSSGGQS